MVSHVLYKERDVEIVGELGEYAYIHLKLTDKLRWKEREKIFSSVLRKLRDMGYKQVFCLIPLDNMLAKEKNGVSRAERMLNFQRLSKSKDYLFLMRKTNV